MCRLWCCNIADVLNVENIAKWTITFQFPNVLVSEKQGEVTPTDSQVRAVIMGQNFDQLFGVV